MVRFAVFMALFDLDHKYKIWIYRYGLILLAIAFPVGTILVGVNANNHYGEDILKRRDHPMFNGKLEKLFYLVGYLFSVSTVYNLVAWIL